MTPSRRTPPPARKAKRKPTKRAASSNRKPKKKTKLDLAEQLYVADRAAWRAWLEEHHATKTGIWVIYDKKGAGRDRLPYGDAVEEALCFGWIDSLVRPLSDTQYLQFFAPRKPKSNWSKSNKDRVERLIAQGLMTPAGMAPIEIAKQNGSWTNLDMAESLTVPDDLAAALAKEPTAARNFAAFTPGARKAYLYWVTGAKRPETRAARIAEVVQRAAKNIKSRQM